MPSTGSTTGSGKADRLGVQADGSYVVYLDADFRPVVQAEAVLVKVIKPNGDVLFGTPQKVVRQ